MTIFSQLRQGQSDVAERFGQKNPTEGTVACLARQPILDAKLKLFGYELLYRSSTGGSFGDSDGSEATLQVLGGSLLGFGLDQLLGSALGFVNFPRELLLSDLATTLPKESLVIEILESVGPDEQVIASCRKLKNLGYNLALDDIDPSTPSLALADLVMVIKVDYRATSRSERAALVKRYRRPGLRMLAEKVETREEFVQAKREGFDLFQGYFFARPVILTRREVPALKLNYIRFLAATQSSNPDFHRLERLIRLEPSLCVRMLKYVNSALFGQNVPTESISQALVFLGEAGLRRWASLAVLPGLASDRPGALLTCSLQRARFLESIAGSAGLSERKEAMFLMGLLSLLDVMVGRPLEELLEPIGMAQDTVDAILGRAPEDSKLSMAYRLALASEKANWDVLASLARELGLTADEVSSHFLDAIRWSEEIVRS